MNVHLTKVDAAAAGADAPAEGARLWAQSERLTGVTFAP